MHKKQVYNSCILSIYIHLKYVYNSITRSNKTTQTQATELTILINLYHVPVSERSSNTNRHASDTEVATNQIRKGDQAYVHIKSGVREQGSGDQTV